MKALSKNQKKGKYPPRGPGRLVTASDFGDQLKLTATQFAERAARQHAGRAFTLVEDTIKDMSLIIVQLRELIPYCDSKGLKDVTDSYRGAVTEIRRALGLSEDVAGQGQKTLVSIQCVGEVHVQGPEGSSAMKPLAQMPDLSKLLPPKQ